MEEGKIETQNLGLKKNLIGAIESLDPEKVFSALRDLDKYLTGAPGGTFADKPDASVAGVKSDIIKFLSEIKTKEYPGMVIYLSSGMSRISIWIDDNNQIRLELTDGSSKSVKDKWAKLS